VRVGVRGKGWLVVARGVKGWRGASRGGQGVVKGWSRGGGLRCLGKRLEGEVLLVIVLVPHEIPLEVREVREVRRGWVAGWRVGGWRVGRVWGSVECGGVWSVGECGVWGSVECGGVWSVESGVWCRGERGQRGHLLTLPSACMATTWPVKVPPVKSPIGSKRLQNSSPCSAAAGGGLPTAGSSCSSAASSPPPCRLPPLPPLAGRGLLIARSETMCAPARGTRHR
jgi:hypothetical protein